MRRKILLTVWMFLCATQLYAGETLIGYVDLQRALNESDSGKDAKAVFNKRVEELQKSLDERQDELKKLQDELEKQKGLLTSEGRSEKEKQYQQRLKDAQRFAKDSQEELQQKDAEMTKKIISEIRTVIKKIGQDEGYTMIIERGEGLVIYAAEGGDLTDRVIKAYNKTRK